MQVSIESIEGLERRMTVTLPAEQINQEVEKRLQNIARTAKMDGFRPGKVPISVVRRRHSQQVRQEVQGELIQSSYFEALTQENLQPAGDPAIEPVEGDSGGDFGFTAVFEVMPEIELNDISDVQIQRPTAEVTDDDLEQMIEKLRKQRSTWADVERGAKTEDQVTINFKGFIDGEAFEGGSADGVPLVLGSNSMIEGFEEGLVGATSGETRTLELKFPENYGAGKLAGKPATFEVEVVKVAEPVLPELDDEFITAFGVAEGGVDALKKEVRSNMERELNDKIRDILKAKAMDALLEANPITVPQSIVMQEAQALKDQTKANMEQSGQSSTMDLPLNLFEDQAKRRVSLGLIVADVIKQNEIKLDEERVQSKIEQLAQSYEKPEEVIEFYKSNQEHMAAIQNVVLEDQVVDWVLDNAKVEEVTSGFDDITKPTAKAAE